MVKLRERRIDQAHRRRSFRRGQGRRLLGPGACGVWVRVYLPGAKVYVVQTYLAGKSKGVMVGRHGLITADRVRRRAALTIGRMKQGVSVP